MSRLENFKQNKSQRNLNNYQNAWIHPPWWRLCNEFSFAFKFLRPESTLHRKIHSSEWDSRHEKSKSGSDCTNRFPKLESLNMKNRPDLFQFGKGNLWCIEIGGAEKSKYCCSMSVGVLTKSQRTHIKVKFGNREVNSCDALFYSLFHFKNIVGQLFDFVFGNIQYAHVQYVHQLIRKLFEVIGGDSQHSKFFEIGERFERRFLQLVVIHEQLLDQMTRLKNHFRHDVQSWAGNIHSTRLRHLRRCLQ